MRGHRRKAFGRRRLSARQIEILLLYFSLKKPTMSEVARQLGISPSGLRSTLYPLVERGYMEQLYIGRWRAVRLTDKGETYCRKKIAARARTEKRAKESAIRLRNEWIWRERRQGLYWWMIAHKLERCPKAWPRIISPDALNRAAETHDKDNNLPAVNAATLDRSTATSVARSDSPQGSP